MYLSRVACFVYCCLRIVNRREKNMQKSLLLLLASFVLLSILLYSAHLVRKRQILKNSQDSFIVDLVELSAHVHKYKQHDDRGLTFAIHRVKKANVFFFVYEIAALISGDWSCPGYDYELVILFPECAETDPAFTQIVNDLSNTIIFLANLEAGSKPVHKYERSYRSLLKSYSTGISTIRTVQLVFLRGCPEYYRWPEDGIVSHSEPYTVMVNNLTYN